MKKENINLKGLENYDITGGTIMLSSINKDSEIGVTPELVVDFMQEFAEKHEKLVYCSVRKSGGSSKVRGSYTRVNVDFSYAIKKDNKDPGNKAVGEVWDRVIRHEFYKAFGGAVEGWDMSARLRMCYINTKLLSLEKK